MVTLADIQKNEDIKALISAGNRYLAAMGFTEHGPRHVSYVSRTAAGILAALHFSPREVELAAIAGWVHDVGNSVNRHDHGPLGAVLLLPILRETGMAMDDVMEIITAVGNHEEQSGFISSAVSAALAHSLMVNITLPTISAAPCTSISAKKQPPSSWNTWMRSTWPTAARVPKCIPPQEPA